MCCVYPTLLRISFPYINSLMGQQEGLWNSLLNKFLSENWRIEISLLQEWLIMHLEYTTLYTLLLVMIVVL